MSVHIRECLFSNGSLLFTEVLQLDSVPSFTWNKSGDHSSNASTPTNWEIHSGLTFGQGVNCSVHKVDLPREMTFNEETLISVVAYCCIFLIALVGNLLVFTTLWGDRRSRVNLCILHLSVADLFVACIFLPLEVTWHITVSWRAGDLVCRLCMLLRAYGFYLSSYITVVIAIDRYMSIVHPLVLSCSIKRCKIMLTSAYVISFLFSLPQSVIFHLEYHPVFTWFSQCITFNFFSSELDEMVYDVFVFVAVYAAPLLIMVTMYTLILIKLCRQHTKHDVTGKPSSHAIKRLIQETLPAHLHPRLRCSRTGYLIKARMKTFKMTLCIVCAFILCWTPNFLVILYYWLAKDSASQMDSKTKRILLIFAVSNSCLDPLIYGMFTTSFQRKFKKWKEYVYQICTP
ncbi:gonadotropin-releasing hormone II receptor [Biomphalaria pfeifferi]|uniref:Gonadotropin-releasing hormone II receptor n=1 Tax=Biomphalaria pfeifferi TaxID=112525 RepID=A0AAD8FJ85_BIOPF|nr:gonadotropin-releasing hormone II receptor [Biomphalaria pfeifferi]